MNLRFVFAIIPLLLAGCNSGEDVKNLNRIESFIQERPDSALKSLSQIDTSTLTSNEGKALFSLLYSIALDKNYVDLESDSLIARAVDYYSLRGDKYHRFLCFYYLGRVYENAGTFDDAMESYLRAESFLNDSVPDEYKARMYSHKARVYFKQFALDRALEETLKSKEYAAKVDNPLFYIRNSLDVASLCTTKGNYQAAADELDNLNEWMSLRGVQKPLEYYDSRLRIALADSMEVKESLLERCTEYCNACDSSNISPNYMLVSKVMSAVGLQENAKQALGLYELPASSSDFDKIVYYDQLADILASEGDYERAYEAEKTYETYFEKVNIDIFNNDVRFLEERHNNAIQAEKSLRLRIGMWALIALLLVSITIVVVVYKRKEKHYKQAVSEARAEYSFISEIVKGNSSMAFRDTLNGRLDALRPYLYSDRITPSTFRARKDIDSIDVGRKEMLKSIGMIYALSYPVFTSRLVNYGLSAEEVGLCALYVCGFSSKEMKDYLHTGSILHINGSIRKKIGESVDGMKLNTWLNKLFSES